MKLMVSVLMICMLLSGCATLEEGMTPREKAGTEIGALLGGIAGAIIDKDNPWRGGVIGATGGAIVGNIVGNIVDQAAKESARKNCQVRYSRITSQGWEEELVAKPCGYQGNFKVIRVEYYRNGRLIGEEKKLVPMY